MNQEFIEFMDGTLKALPHKDRLPCLYHFKALSAEVYRIPEPDLYRAFQDEYDDYLSAIADEQKNCDPVKWINFKIEEITVLGGWLTETKNNLMIHQKHQRQHSTQNLSPNVK